MLDCNSDGAIDISDGIRHLEALFLGRGLPDCPEACDANGDARRDISDTVYIFNYRFFEGPPPRPFPECGVDPAAEGGFGCGGFGCS